MRRRQKVEALLALAGDDVRVEPTKLQKWWWRLDLRYKVSRWYEKMRMQLVWWMPRSWVYWAVIRATCHATTGPYGNTDVPEVTAVEVLKRWEKKHS